MEVDRFTGLQDKRLLVGDRLLPTGFYHTATRYEKDGAVMVGLEGIATQTAEVLDQRKRDSHVLAPHTYSQPWDEEILKKHPCDAGQRIDDLLSYPTDSRHRILLNPDRTFPATPQKPLEIIPLLPNYDDGDQLVLIAFFNGKDDRGREGSGPVTYERHSFNPNGVVRRFDWVEIDTINSLVTVRYQEKASFKYLQVAQRYDSKHCVLIRYLHRRWVLPK